MNPVIRIPDKIYERLQRHAVPFVDNPATVVEKLLDFYESQGTEQSPSAIIQARETSARYSSSNNVKISEGVAKNLFLVPAIQENARASIEKTVGLDEAEPYLTKERYLALKHSLEGRLSFYCWATTRNRVSVFNEMRPGDIAVLTIKGSGLFTHYGKIIYTFTSEQLGEYIWPVAPSHPWKYIYVFDEIHPLRIDKRELVSTLGFQSTYVVPGIIRVSPSRVSRIENRYGSIESFLQALNK